MTEGGIWFDFNDAKPRDLRMGVFPAVPAGQTGIPESDPQAPLIRVPGIGFKNDAWHHVVLTWANFDTGRPDAHAALYIDGKLLGEVKDRAVRTVKGGIQGERVHGKAGGLLHPCSLPEGG